MTAPRRDRLRSIHRAQTHRDPWPDFAGYDSSAHSPELRRAAAVQWAGRARNELGSVHQFTAVSRILCELRAPLDLLGALSRLITDEVRHTELCAEAARALWPEGVEEEPTVFRFETPRLPWGSAPDDERGRWRWVTDAILTSCCMGETLSKPMLDAIALVSTDPLPAAVAKQILRDEHLHATFGWEAAAVLLPLLDDDDREYLQVRAARNLGSFERSTCRDLLIEQLVGQEVEITAGDPSEPNLGTLSPLQYSAIFYDTMQQEILPGLDELGLDSQRAWAERRGVPTSA